MLSGRSLSCTVLAAQWPPLLGTACHHHTQVALLNTSHNVSRQTLLQLQPHRNKDGLLAESSLFVASDLICTQSPISLDSITASVMPRFVLESYLHDYFCRQIRNPQFGFVHFFPRFSVFVDNFCSVSVRVV